MIQKKKSAFLTFLILITLSLLFTVSVSANTGQSLSFGKKVSGEITDNNTKDTYNVTLKEPGELNLLFDSFIADRVDVEVTDAKGTRVFRDGVTDGKPTDPVHWEGSEFLEAGTYYIHVDRFAWYHGVYDIEVDFNATNNNEKEPNNGKTQAQSIGLNNQIKGLISWNDDVDTYKVTLSKKEDITFNFTSYIYRGVDVTVEDEKGKKLLSKYVTVDKNKDQETVTWKEQLNAGTYYIYVKKGLSFTGTYDLSMATIDFADVVPGTYYYGSVIKLTADGIISGYSDGDFHPHDNIPRWQSILLLQRALDLDIPKDYKKIANTFKDVGEKHPYAGEIAAVYKAGIFQGNENVMGVNDLLTREQMASVIVRGFKLKGDKTKDSLANVTDAKQIASYHKDDVKTLYDLGVTTGTGDGKYSPNGHMTRAEFVTFIDRIKK